MNCARTGIMTLIGDLSEMMMSFPLVVIPLIVALLVAFTASLPTISLNALTKIAFDLETRSNELIDQTTSSTVKSFPSDHLMPDLSVKVSVLPSLLNL